MEAHRQDNFTLALSEYASGLYGAACYGENPRHLPRLKDAVRETAEALEAARHASDVALVRRVCAYLKTYGIGVTYPPRPHQYAAIPVALLDDPAAVLAEIQKEEG